jgi:hypothetical protein
VGDERFQGGIQLGDLGGQRLVAAGHGGHGRFNRLGWAGEVAGAEPGRRRDSLGGGQGGQLLPQRLGGSDDQAAELVAGLGAALTAPRRACGVPEIVLVCELHRCAGRACRT